MCGVLSSIMINYVLSAVQHCAKLCVVCCAELCYSKVCVLRRILLYYILCAHDRCAVLCVVFNEALFNEALQCCAVLCFV